MTGKRTIAGWYAEAEREIAKAAATGTLATGEEYAEARRIREQENTIIAKKITVKPPPRETS